MGQYMTVIDQREAELAAKSGMLEQLSSQLAKYLSPQLYESIFSGRQEVKVASSRKKLSIFFSDIVGFTETADQLESEDLTQLLNQYLTEMSRIALEHGATIDKYIGDGMLIFLGDPESRGVREDALACVRMATAMRRRLHELAVTWRAAGIARPLQTRMGIHTGFCTVGNFGSEDRLDYTIVGGAVNIAARLEELAAADEILVSFETFALIDGEIACEPMGSVEVKGIGHPIQTYRVVDPDRDEAAASELVHEALPAFRLELDLAGLSDADRASARRALGRALRLLDR
jgi:class 3 adenylate cyclase